MAERVTEPNLCTRVVRVPVPDGSWNSGYLNSYLKPYVDALTARGVYVIIDYHAISTYQDKDAAVRSFWSAVAPAFKDYTNVLYEAFNEPTMPGGSAAAWETWKTTAQPWIDLMRSLAPETLILVGSPTWCQDTRFAASSPFKGSNLVYVAHVYPQHTNWDNLFGNASATIPIFLSEWGYQGDGNSGPETRGTTTSYGVPMKAYLEAHPNVNWAAWIYDHSWWPIMIDSSYALRGGENYQGVFMRDYLQEKCSSDLPSGGSAGGATNGVAGSTNRAGASNAGGTTSGGASNRGGASNAGGATTVAAGGTSGAAAVGGRSGASGSANSGAGAGTGTGTMGGATQGSTVGGAIAQAGSNTAAAPGAGATPSTAGGSNANPPTTDDSSSCGCKLGEQPARTGGIAAIVLASLLIGLRRPRPRQRAKRVG